MGIIGGADGPQVYITSSAGWLNAAGLAVVALMLLPNIFYALKHKNTQNHCKSKWINLFEQIGRYGCMLLMVFHIGIKEFGFRSPEGLVAYLIGNAVLLLLYWAVWMVYFKRPGRLAAYMLAVLPALIFLLCGLTLRHWLLVGFAAVFGIAHIAVTYINRKAAR